MKLKPIQQHINDALQHIVNSSFVKNIFVVMTGTALAQIIGFALTPIISRIYSPSDFGIFGSFQAILSVIAAGVTLDYSQAVMLPKHNHNAINVFLISILSSLFIGLCCLIVSIAAPYAILGLIKTSDKWLLLLLVVSVIASGFNQSCQAWCIRVKAFKHTSASQVIRSVSDNSTQIGLGFLKGGNPTSLIIASIIGDILATVNLIRVTIPYILMERKKINIGSILKLTKEYKDFPLLSASQNVLNALSNGLPVLLLTHFYGIATAGAFAFGSRILSVPMRFILTSLRQVLFQKASETYNNGGKLFPVFLKTTGGLFIMTVAPSVIMFIWAPQIFSLVFGSKWFIAGEFSRGLLIWMIFAFCNLPAVLFVKIFRIQRYTFYYELILLTLRTLSLVLGGLYFNAMNTVMLFALVGAVMNMLLIVGVGYIILRKEGSSLKDNLKLSNIFTFR